MAPVLETGISIPGTSYREMQKMDKYEFNIKVEQIKKMVNKGDYETAMKIADTIDWRRVRNVNILSMVATIYEKNQEYQEAKDILLLAVATSIDALAVGISFAFLKVDIIPAVCLIGITTFIISCIAVFLGNKIGGKLGKYAEITGGVILILIGLKILIEHLFGL